MVSKSDLPGAGIIAQAMIIHTQNSNRRARFSPYNAASLETLQDVGTEKAGEAGARAEDSRLLGIY